MAKFSDYGLLDSLVKTLRSTQISTPTEIQNNAIPTLMGGQSVVGVAETGSGKTLAYALPLLHKLKSMEQDGHEVYENSSPRAVVMVPSRELGEQVSKVFKTLTHDTRLRVRPALGGMTMEQARRNTSGPFEILLATPGRLMQMLQLKYIDLSDVRFLVFDEADQMLDQGFISDSNNIYYACPSQVQLALFSATISPSVQELINGMFSKAELYRSAGAGKTVKTLVTQNRIIKDGKRWPLLDKLLKEPSAGSTILFTNTREQCDKLAKELADNGYEAVIYRGEMEKAERKTNLRKFATGKVKFMVATDLAGRGLDIPNVDRVINYHLPKEKDNYLHRAGRTARAGRKGVVVNFVTERDEAFIAGLEGRKLEKDRDKTKFNSYAKPATKASKTGKPMKKGKPTMSAKPAAKSGKPAPAGKSGKPTKKFGKK
ncbi:DEAD/DEAH box helicase [Bdellovibrio sp. HCB209]|uniref:DEAD/DEAH box helicase n=1 Tax=Bdellovibrio sp. HCB209 TaxID=3394354 RepID=UPI0039B6A434